MSYPLLTTCPVCSGELVATRLDCVTCQATVEATFDLGFLKHLNQDQVHLITLLVKNRGNMNRIATELGVHYNTVRNRMDELATAMGIAEAAVPAPDPQRMGLLEQLGRGDLTPEEALQRLRGRPSGTDEDDT